MQLGVTFLWAQVEEMDYEESKEAGHAFQVLIQCRGSVHVYSDWNDGRSWQVDWKHEVTTPVCIFDAFQQALFKPTTKCVAYVLWKDHDCMFLERFFR